MKLPANTYKTNYQAILNYQKHKTTLNNLIFRFFVRTFFLEKKPKHVTAFATNFYQPSDIHSYALQFSSGTKS